MIDSGSAFNYARKTDILKELRSVDRPIEAEEKTRHCVTHSEILDFTERLNAVSFPVWICHDFGHNLVSTAELQHYGIGSESPSLQSYILLEYKQEMIKLIDGFVIFIGQILCKEPFSPQMSMVCVDAHRLFNQAPCSSFKLQIQYLGIVVSKYPEHIDCAVCRQTKIKHKIYNNRKGFRI